MIRRGQIWWVDCAEPLGSEPGFRHPALVPQRDEVNASRIDTVVVCVLTSNRALANAPGNTLLSKRMTGLPRDSVANASQIATVNKGDLAEAGRHPCWSRHGTRQRGPALVLAARRVMAPPPAAPLAAGGW